MAKVKARARATTAKSDGAVEALVEALGQATEVERVFGVHRALDQRTDRAALATAALAGTEQGGVARRWVAVIAGAGTDEDARAVAELCTAATAGRVAMAAALGEVAGRIDDALLARAILQLEEATPFASVVLSERGRAAVRVRDPACAKRLDARSAFAAGHARLLADLGEDAKEKDRNAAIASLDQLTGDDRVHAAIWISSMVGQRSDALPWARRVAVAEPRVPPVLAASLLATGYISDDDEIEFGKLIADAGDRGRDHALAILDEGVDRGWGQVVEHLAPARPELFATPRGFDAVIRGFARRDAVTYRLCEDARTWVIALDAAQAARVAEILIPLCEEAVEGHFLHHSVGRAFFYFRNPGGLATFTAKLADPAISDHLRDELYDAIYQIPGRASQDVLIDQLFVETRLVRDLVFSFNDACMPHRHADVLARLDATPSLDAAWIYGGCQMHWAHRPRLLLDVVERVIAWGEIGGDPARRANLLSDGVRCALELRRYPLAVRCLELLGDTRECLEPTSKEPAKTVLADKELAKQLADLRSGKLAAAQQRVTDEVAAARASGTPSAADDERLGLLAGGQVAYRFHTDSKTREVWFLDAEHELFYYDGFGIAEPPFAFTRFALDEGYHAEVPGLAAWCAGWRTGGRSLHVNSSDGAKREVVRSGSRIAIRVYHSSPLVAFRVFGLAFADEASAAAAFAALDRDPLDGYRAVDPFYIPGKRGGTWIREWGNRTEVGFVVGNQHAWGESRWKAERHPHASHDAAIAAFEERAASCLARGLFPRTLELDDKQRPLEDTPLYTWLDDRERNDSQTAGWHLQALPAIRAAMVPTGLPLDEVEVELGPPATQAELAAYDAALPEPMPETMREMWATASNARWRVGDHSERLLSPTEVIRDRDTRRDQIARQIARHKKAKRITLDPSQLDVFLVRDDEPWLAFDIRQQREDGCYKIEDAYLLESGQGLVWSLAEGFASDFVDALVDRFPVIKKLSYGQAATDLATKKPKPKAKAKTVTKKKRA